MEPVFAALLSADDAKVLGALAAVEARGDARAIRPLLHALAGARDQGVRQRITAMLNQVKVPDAARELIAALDEPSLAGVRSAVLSALWNAGLDVRDHLEVLVGVAISGTAEECFECLTVVENQELWPER
ncbi:MAG TPA: HEAT repeat domain-containing protein, partial [Flavobacteriales bacterium]|nr:HEAT repeat domain-containing protein [Flavobacteriales bacterium]